MNTFSTMLTTARNGMEFSKKDFAALIGVSGQYLGDLERGRRLPSVAVVEKICDKLGRGPLGIQEWNIAGAKAHGWKINWISIKDKT